MSGTLRAMEFIVLPNPDDVADHAADLVAAQIAAHDHVVLGLAGGSTPLATYRALAARDLNWATTSAWMTDERWVPPTHPDSNQAMVQETLVTPTGVEFLRPDTTLPSPSDAADAFSHVLTSVCRAQSRSVTLLGLGTDGHTASLFPDTAALECSGARYVANFVPKLDAWRLTATVDLLSASDVVAFLVTGSSKAGIVAAIAAGADVPAARITAREHVVWLLDEDAAADLT